MDQMVNLAGYVGEHYGLLPAYAIIITIAALFANNKKHLLFMLSIMGGVYITMFKAFNLQGKLFTFDVMALLPNHELPAGLTLDHVNKIAALLFVYLVGFTVYGMKRLTFPKAA